MLPARGGATLVVLLRCQPAKVCHSARGCSASRRGALRARGGAARMQEKEVGGGRRWRWPVQDGGDSIRKVEQVRLS